MGRPSRTPLGFESRAVHWAGTLSIRNTGREGVAGVTVDVYVLKEPDFVGRSLNAAPVI